MNDEYKTLGIFMDAWLNQNWHKAVKVTQFTWQKSKDQDGFIKRFLINDNNEKRIRYANLVQTLKGLLIPFHLTKYKIKGYKTISSVTKDIKVDIDYQSEIGIQHKTLIARLIREEAPMMPSTKGKWGINPISLFIKRG
jgi:hypothetical protein